MKEIKMDLPDWTRQTGLLLPQPERYVLVSIFQISGELSELSFADLYEKVKTKITNTELQNALINLKEDGLIVYTKTFGSDGFLGITLTFKGKISASNGGQISETKKEGLNGVIFDSNVFDTILKDSFILALLEKSKEKYEYYITHVQIDEIENCQDDEKRKRLQLAAHSLRPKVIATESFVLGTSRLGFAKLSDGKDLEKLRKFKKDNTNDGLIAETAIKNGLLLITNDIELQKTVAQNNGDVINSTEFISLLKSGK